MPRLDDQGRTPNAVTDWVQDDGLQRGRRVDDDSTGFDDAALDWRASGSSPVEAREGPPVVLKRAEPHIVAAAQLCANTRCCFTNSAPYQRKTDKGLLQGTATLGTYSGASQRSTFGWM